MTCFDCLLWLCRSGQIISLVNPKVKDFVVPRVFPVRLILRELTMLVLFETPAGHALFKVQDDAAIRSASNNDFESETVIKSLVKLKSFSRFSDTTMALAAATALVEGKPSKELRKFLKKQVAASDQLAVADSKLAAAIKDKTGLQCVFSSEITDLMRGIRSNLDTLLEGEDMAVSGASRSAMVLGLAHSLSRYKLKFSPDKVDTMIVQAISLLDELDKEINTYAMRLREWYGWHFPEMGKVVSENAAYARAVDKMGVRSKAAVCDFSSILSAEAEAELKQAALISMGTEISEEDVLNIRSLCEQVISLTDYRSTLYEYLKNRMVAIAPNLTAMVGELVGARLIAHAGSLLNLAKLPASTVQILGAEKALFRALKTKHATPKYGLIFHASVVGQASSKHKGKISRSLAAKTALSVRVDSLGEAGEDATVGEEGRLAIERRLTQLEGREFAISRIKVDEKMPKYQTPDGAGKRYNNAGDVVLFDEKQESKANGIGSLDNAGVAFDVENTEDVQFAKDVSIIEGDSGKAKRKKEKRSSKGGEEVVEAVESEEILQSTPKAKKKTDKDRHSSGKKDKKRKRMSEVDTPDGGSEKKKKKLKKS